MENIYRKSVLKASAIPRGYGGQVGQAMGDINFDGDVFNVYKKHIYIISLITTFSFCW